MKRYGVLFSLIIVGSMAAMKDRSKDPSYDATLLKNWAAATKQDQVPKKEDKTKENPVRKLGLTSSASVSYFCLLKPPVSGIQSTHHALFELDEVREEKLRS